MSKFTFADVLQWDETELEPVEEVFTNRKGKTITLTILPLAEESAEAYFELSRLSQAKEDESDLIVSLPDGSKTLEIRDKSYIASLRFLARVVAEPKMSLSEWAIFGHKIGGPRMNQILLRAIDINGLAPKKIEQEDEDAKNA